MRTLSTDCDHAVTWAARQKVLPAFLVFHISLVIFFQFVSVSCSLASPHFCYSSTFKTSKHPCIKKSDNASVTISQQARVGRETQPWTWRDTILKRMKTTCPRMGKVRATPSARRHPAFRQRSQLRSPNPVKCMYVARDGVACFNLF